MSTSHAKHATRRILAGAVLVTLGLGGWIGVHGMLSIDERVAEIELRVALEPRLVAMLEREVQNVRTEIQNIRGELSRASEDADATKRLEERLFGAESRLQDIGTAIEAHGSSLAELEEATSIFGPDLLEARLDERDQMLEERWNNMRALISTASEMADESRREIERLETSLSTRRDLMGMWEDLVAPVVQLAGDNSVGSGVLLESERIEGTEPAEYRTYLLTAWHVVRDIIEGDDELPVPVTIYLQDGSIRTEFAELLERDIVVDVALLRIEGPDPLPYGASLATRERLEDVHIFDRVYAVGCPLGNDPIPTPGEVATYRHEVDGIVYWMINAPTYIGNSGGGIFDADTHELLGVFSKIYTHGALRPTIVPHMGLVTPLDGIYDWLETAGFGELIPSSEPNDDHVASTED